FAFSDLAGRKQMVRSSSTKTAAGNWLKGGGRLLGLFVAGVVIILVLTGGCSHFDKGHKASALTREATDFFNRGNYAAALAKYAQIIENHPEAADRALFEMGITYAYPRNASKDYHKSLDCFQRLVREHPDSEYRHEGQMMILQINNVILKDNIIATQRAELEAIRQKLESNAEALRSKTNETVELQETIAALEETVFLLRTEPADKVLIEKQARRLTLLSKGEVIKTYKIALGGNPIGPKERMGDNKTPEGTYIIDARNDNSDYHLSLHISYPNEKDKLRARELGVSPGGDIMIHGIKNSFSQIGASHAERDWTQGCIAVTNQEMEEIYQLVPNGTVVEIKP
ncbi:MAG: L,D-transpeptidase family protein, partial [Desulfosarcina sp.]